MSRFLSKLVIENADNSDDGQWILVEALIYESASLANLEGYWPTLIRASQTIIVPAGFQTDLASVPRIPIAFELFGATSNEAAALHDYLYATHPVDRKTADALLREASSATGVPWWRRWPMWAGVRVFGGSHWKIKPGIHKRSLRAQFVAQRKKNAKAT